MLMEKVTKRQNELLQAIYESVRDEGFPPSFDELREHFNISSNQAILDHLNALEKKKLIKRGDKSARSITILPLGYKTLSQEPLIPVLGIAQAGAFAQTMDLVGEWQQVSDDVTKFQGQTYIIRINGDSMINAQIENGCTLLIQEAEHFSHNDIVVAHSPDGEVVKRFISQDVPPYMFLKSENPAYKNIPFTDDITLQGKIIAKLEGKMWRPFKQGQLV